MTFFEVRILGKVWRYFRFDGDVVKLQHIVRLLMVGVSRAMLLLLFKDLRMRQSEGKREGRSNAVDVAHWVTWRPLRLPAS